MLHFGVGSSLFSALEKDTKEASRLINQGRYIQYCNNNNNNGSIEVVARLESS